MTDTEIIEDVKKFVDKALNGDIRNFKNYCFWNLKGSKLGESSTKNSFDSDDTELARMIYSLVWGIESDSIGTNRDFRGDTVNSFATIMSKSLEMQVLNNLCNDNKRLPVLQIRNIQIENERLINKIYDFSRKYLTIGNFTVLPNRKHEGVNENLNTFRAHAFADCFDSFLLELKNCFLEKSSNTVLKKLFDVNKSIFQHDSSNPEKSFEKFCSTFFLNDYLEMLNDNKRFFAQLRWWEDLTESAAQEYFDQLEYFLDTAMVIIDNRNDKFIEVLKEKIC